MLLLDEPTNHLDAESVAWLERFLHDYEGNRRGHHPRPLLLDNVAGWILELDRGEGIPLGGATTPPGWSKRCPSGPRKRVPKPPVASPSRRNWSGFCQNLKGRQAKSKARMARFEEPNTNDYQKRNETNELFIPPGPRLGDKVVEVANLCKSHGDRQLIDDLSSIPKGAIVGIIGPNGAGKSTLFRMMSGQEQLDSGSITPGDTVVLASVDQFRDSMNDKKTVFEEVADGQTSCASATTSSRAAPTSAASTSRVPTSRSGSASSGGGERGRLHLAKLLQTGGNVLLLDEPTNDLDIETLRALENALLEFPGCAMVISPRPLVPRLHRHPHPGTTRTRARSNSLKATSPNTKSGRRRPYGAEAIQPRRAKYKRIAGKARQQLHRQV